MPGVNSPTPLLEITEEEFHRIIDGNLLATLLGCQVFGKHMIEAGGGAILNIGSVTSFRPLSRVFTYSASKAGVLNLTRNVAHDLAKHKIRVNCLCPGFFPAEQNRKILDPRPGGVDLATHADGPAGRCSGTDRGGAAVACIRWRGALLRAKRCMSMAGLRRSRFNVRAGPQAYT